MVKVFDLNGDVIGETKLPKVFSTPYRKDLILRSVLSSWSERRQPYGSDILAGKKTSAHYHGRRRYRFTMMNREMARIARIHGKVGYLAFRARFVPQAVKGRAAHPPKVEKIWLKKINKKENLLAVKSAIAATSNSDLVKERGHKFSGDVPIIIDDDFENLKKSKDAKTFLEKLKLGNEIKRCEKKKIRAGKGKMRGRRYKKKKGLLIVVSGDCDLLKAARNLAGVDVVKYNELNTELLAPGAQAGRLTIFTKSSLGKLNEKFV